MDADETRERRQRRASTRLALPSPRPAVVAIAVTVVEVQAGVRSPQRLERLSHYSLWPVWDFLADQAIRDPSAAAAHPLTVVVQEHVPGLVDATVVVGFAGRAEPLALRLDGAHGRWELIELECASQVALDRTAHVLHMPTAEPTRASHPPAPDTVHGTHRTDLPLEVSWRARLDPERALDRSDGPGIDLQ